MMQSTVPFHRRTLLPVGLLAAIAALSWVIYNVAWRSSSVGLHHALATVFGTLLFVSVALGPSVLYPLLRLRGAGLAERVLAVYFVPFLWATKECLRLTLSFTVLEALYYYLNPLALWLYLGTLAQIGLAELFCRWRLRRDDPELRVLHPGALAAFVLGLSAVIGLYAWGKGENIYALFLAGYRVLFGAGIGVDG